MSLFQSLAVSASGMSAQSARAQIITENLANSETTRTPDGGPYRRKDVVFESQAQTTPFSAIFAEEFSPGAMGVAAADVREDDRPPRCAINRAIRTPTSAGTWLTRTSVRPKRWWTSWGRRAAIRPTSPRSARPRTWSTNRSTS